MFLHVAGSSAYSAAVELCLHSPQRPIKHEDSLLGSAASWRLTIRTGKHSSIEISQVFLKLQVEMTVTVVVVMVVPVVED
jgi:hypothetical protein